MLNRLISLILTIILLVSVCSCAALPTLDTTDENPVKDNTGTKENDSKKEATTIVLNETFAVGEVFELTLSDAEWCEKILPSNTNGVYSYYDDEPQEKYFVIHGKLKNLSAATVDIQWSSNVEMIINGKYKMSGRMELEESDGTSFYGNAKPLQTLNLIIYGSASDELYEAYETLTANISIVSDEEKLNYFYNKDFAQEHFTITFNK